MKIIVIKCSFFHVSCVCVFSNIIVFCFLVHISKYKLCAFLHGVVSYPITAPSPLLPHPSPFLPHFSPLVHHLSPAHHISLFSSLTSPLSPLTPHPIPHPLTLLPNLSSFLHHASSPHLISASSPSCSWIFHAYSILITHPLRQQNGFCIGCVKTQKC